MADKNTQPAAWTDADNGVAVWANQADLAEVLRDILGISYDVRLCQTRPVVHQGNTVFLCVLEAPAVALCQAICNGTELRSSGRHSGGYRGGARLLAYSPRSCGAC